MLNNQYAKGQRDALARFKLANLAQGAQGYNPMLNSQAGPRSTNPMTAPPTSPAAPVAAGTAKSQVLG